MPAAGACRPGQAFAPVPQGGVMPTLHDLLFFEPFDYGGTLSTESADLSLLLFTEFLLEVITTWTLSKLPSSVSETAQARWCRVSTTTRTRQQMTLLA